jgi:hypothetical protein
MDKTSQGFHTFTVVMRLTVKEMRELIKDFMRCMNVTGLIKFFPLDFNRGKVPDDADEFTQKLYSSSTRYFVAHYTDRSRGIIWLLRYSNASHGFIRPGEVDRPCSIKVTINPKILTGENDYLTAATADNLEAIEAIFNAEAAKISPLLGVFRLYAMNRPDYCVNFDLDELKIPCSPEQMIYLIKRGDIPRHYAEWTEDIIDGDTSKKGKPNKDSFYLESNSVTINCYRKYRQLEKEFPDCPDRGASYNIIRFEVQWKYLKTYALSANIRKNPGTTYFDVIQEMLSEEFCADIIKGYFNRVIREGDYYTLDGAIKKVQFRRFSRNKEARIICELRRVNQSRGVHKVKGALQGEELNTFSRTLRDLADIGVNPVTIPKHWGIPHIPNLLAAYDKKIEAERRRKAREEFQLECLKDYLGGNLKKKSKK